MKKEIKKMTKIDIINSLMAMIIVIIFVLLSLLFNTYHSTSSLLIIWFCSWIIFNQSYIINKLNKGHK